MYTRDRAEFDYAVNLITPYARWSWQLPTDSNLRVAYFDSADYCRAGFGRFLNKICDSSGDDAFYLVMLKPDPVNWFYEKFHVYPLLTLHSSATEDEYVKARSEGVGPKLNCTISDVATTAAIFPQSLKWHIFLQEEPELARLVSSTEIPSPIDDVPWIMPEEELQKRLNWIKEHPEVAP